jgi:hypothetical protein
MTTTTLAQLNQALVLLRSATTLEDISHIRNIAQAAEQYARAEKLGDEAERQAREVRTRAARKAGEVLKRMVETGDRASRVDRRTYRTPRDVPPPTLTDLGITADLSSRWQRIADIPEADFEKGVAEGWGETALARGGRGASHPRTRKTLPPKAKANGFTLKQSLTGLQQVAIQVQGLAEGLDGGLLGDWERLYDAPEAQQWFDVIEQSLPVLTARLKRSLRERGQHGNTIRATG